MLLQSRWKALLDPLLKAAGVDSEAVPPVGSLQAYAGATIPDGWLLCDGRDLAKLTYPDLADALGTTWGTPTSQANFRLPDLRGRSLIGAGPGGSLTARTLGTTGGAETHTLSTSEIPSHSHDSRGGNNSPHVQPSVAGGIDGRDWYGLAGALTSKATVTTGSTGGGGAHNNMPPWAAVNWIIKA